VKILGVSNTFDSGAALIVEGEIVGAVNEERFTRTKLDRSFPRYSIEYLLQSPEIAIQDIDTVAVGCWNGIDQKETLPRLIEDVLFQTNSDDPSTVETVMTRINTSGTTDNRLRDELCQELYAIGVTASQIQFYDHHYTHAISAYCPSPFEDALVLTADGRGDFRSVSLWQGSLDGLSLIDMATELTSPGALYGLITKYLGFVPNRHEGKVTGLAAYGKMSGAYDILAQGYQYDYESNRLISHIGDFYSPFASANLESLFRELDAYTREEVAFAVQALLEDSLLAFLEHNIQSLGLDSVNLCLAGGCMANVKLNYRFRKMPQVKGVYVFPHMGDGGLPIGAAMAAVVERGGRRKVFLPTTCLGPEFSDEQIEECLRMTCGPYGLSYERLDQEDIPTLVAGFLAEDRIVGWFQGRMEVGPRALGARSILASATDQTINQSLNMRLDRTEFMPFAPVTTDNYAASCFHGWSPSDLASRFMAMCYDCTVELAEKCPAVVHVDNTARPQVVFREDNPQYYDTIETYVALTGNPVIINTSFNHHEEPIVAAPLEAIHSLHNGNIDVLIVGKWLVQA